MSVRWKPSSKSILGDDGVRRGSRRRRGPCHRAQTFSTRPPAADRRPFVLATGGAGVEEGDALAESGVGAQMTGAFLEARGNVRGRPGPRRASPSSLRPLKAAAWRSTSGAKRRRIGAAGRFQLA